MEKSRADYLLYNEKVRKLTEKTIRREWIKDISLRSDDFHVDHKVSIYECFMNDIPVYMAAHECNLEVMTKEENLTKGRTSSITPQELFEEFMTREIDLMD